MNTRVALTIILAQLLVIALAIAALAYVAAAPRPAVSFPLSPRAACSLLPAPFSFIPFTPAVANGRLPIWGLPISSSVVPARRVPFPSSVASAKEDGRVCPHWHHQPAGCRLTANAGFFTAAALACSAGLPSDESNTAAGRTASHAAGGLTMRGTAPADSFDFKACPRLHVQPEGHARHARAYARLLWASCIPAAPVFSGPSAVRA